VEARQTTEGQTPGIKQKEKNKTQEKEMKKKHQKLKAKGKNKKVVPDKTGYLFIAIIIFLSVYAILTNGSCANKTVNFNERIYLESKWNKIWPGVESFKKANLKNNTFPFTDSPELKEYFELVWEQYSLAEKYLRQSNYAVAKTLLSDIIKKTDWINDSEYYIPVRSEMLIEWINGDKSWLEKDKEKLKAKIIKAFENRDVEGIKKLASAHFELWRYNSGAMYNGYNNIEALFKDLKKEKNLVFSNKRTDSDITIEGFKYLKCSYGEKGAIYISITEAPVKERAYEWTIICIDPKK
jgi:hypothetical protein